MIPETIYLSPSEHIFENQNRKAPNMEYFRGAKCLPFLARIVLRKSLKFEYGLPISRLNFSLQLLDLHRDVIFNFPPSEFEPKTTTLLDLFCYSERAKWHQVYPSLGLYAHFEVPSS